MTTVLLVEDNEMNRDMLSRRLQRAGYAVLCAPDGFAGIALAESEQPDIVLMDIGLPGIDGWETTRRLKAQEGTASIPVVALTAHALSSDREKSLEIGCADFDTKPVDLPRLLSKIERTLKDRA
jgi:CheY-like chemotaxis protein